MKIQEIKAAYQALDPDDEPMLQQFIHTYGTDARSGVQTLVEQTKKKLVQLEAEYVRSEKMLAFERKYHAMGSRYICGIDEVGRGPLAGPVVACAGDLIRYYPGESSCIWYWCCLRETD